MTSAWNRWLVVIALAGVVLSPAVFAAEDSSKTLPTLLIKGEVVSLDANDPAATLLKVKDRYGFETPIYLTQVTKIAKGDQALTAADLAQGTAVEVEYNFDINTAKRHAVSVKVSTAPAAQAAAAPAAAVPAPAAEVSAPPTAPVDAQPAAAVPSAVQPAAQSAAAPTMMPQPAGSAKPADVTATKEPKTTAPAGQATP